VLNLVVRKVAGKLQRVNKQTLFFFFFDGATGRGGPWPPLQYASKPLDTLLSLSLSIRLFPSFSGPLTLNPAISFFCLPLRLVAYSFPYIFFFGGGGLRCLAFFQYDQAIVFFGI